MFAYVGTFTNAAPREGLHAFRFDPNTGRMAHIQHVQVPNPNYLAVSRSRNVLYAASRKGSLGEGESDAIIAYAIDPKDGRLSYLNRAAVPPQPAYVSLDKTERCLLFACTAGGAMGAIRLEPDGMLTAARWVGDGASLADLGYTSGKPGPWPYGTTMPHSIRPSPDNGFALAPDVGRNRIHVHKLDAEQGQLVPHEPAYVEGPPLADAEIRRRSTYWNAPTGAGPRHIEFHPNGRWLYVISELGCVVTLYDWDAASGRLAPRGDISTLPAGFDELNYTADIHVHPNGRFAYGSNRGHESIAIFSVNSSDGSLSFVASEPTGGAHPRNFIIAPGGRLMLVGNLASDNVTVFEVDADTGRLTPTGVVNDAPAPSCTVFFDPGR